MEDSQSSGARLKEGDVTERLQQFVQDIADEDSAYDIRWGASSPAQMEQKISFDLPVDKPPSSSNAFFDDYMEHGNDLTYLDREIDDPKKTDAVQDDDDEEEEEDAQGDHDDANEEEEEDEPPTTRSQTRKRRPRKDNWFYSEPGLTLEAM